MVLVLLLLLLIIIILRVLLAIDNGHTNIRCSDCCTDSRAMFVYITLHYITLITLFCITLFCITLQYTTLRYIKLHYITLSAYIHMYKNSCHMYVPNNEKPRARRFKKKTHTRTHT